MPNLMPNLKLSRKSSSVYAANQKKKVKSQRGVPETNYGEIKEIVSFSLTPTAKKMLKKISKALGISTSELLERLARGLNALKENVSQEAVMEELVAKMLEILHKP